MQVTPNNNYRRSSKDWIVDIMDIDNFDIDLIIRMKYFKYIIYQIQYKEINDGNSFQFIRAYVQTKRFVRQSIFIQRLRGLSGYISVEPWIQDPYKARAECTIFGPKNGQPVEYGNYFDDIDNTINSIKKKLTFDTDSDVDDDNQTIQ